MNRKHTIAARSDHVKQWAEFKRLYVTQRKSDAGRDRKAIPRTTYGDIARLTEYWHRQFITALLLRPKALDRDLASRKRWKVSKQRIDAQLRGADPNALYPQNEWFWQEASKGLAIYLESRKAVPDRAELVIDSITETVNERAEDVKAAARQVANAAPGIGTAVKVGALVIGGLAAAALAARVLRDFYPERPRR